jgi:hypothetical protein
VQQELQQLCEEKWLLRAVMFESEEDEARHSVKSSVVLA